MNKKEMKNTKGISSIIATLILLLLTIVLVGIVWAVVSGIVKTSTEGAASGAQCFNSAIDITSVTCTTAGICTVNVQRTLGTEDIGGIRLVFFNDTGATNFTDLNGNIPALASAVLTQADMGVANVSEVDAAIFFTDAGGNKNVCSGPQEYTNILLTA